MIPVPLPASPWVQDLGWTLIQFLWQGTLIAVLYAGVRATAGRRLPSQARYALACSALGAMTAAPALTWMAGPFVATDASLSSWPLGSPDAWTRAMPGLVAAWLAGVILFSVRLVVGWRITARLRTSGVRPAPAVWQETLDALVGRLRVSRPVRLLVSSLVEAPAVIGWLRPVVLVPVGALTGLPAPHVTALLAHELAHVRRLDYLVNVLQRVVETALFYHPAVWWVSSQIRAEREMCCDDLAVEACGDALTYARALAELESCRRRQAGAALAANGVPLLDRIRRLLGHRPSPLHALPAPSAAAGMTLLWALGIAAVAAHGATSPASDVMPAAIPGPPLDVRTMPDARELISAVLLGPVGPHTSRQPAQAPVVATSRPGVLTPDTGGSAPAAGAGVIRGRVRRSDTDAPLRKVRISLRAESRTAPSPRVPAVSTGDDGRFELSGVPAGRYRLFAEKGSFVMTADDRGPGLDPADVTGRAVAVRDGERIEDLDVRLVPGGVIAGQILDETGMPLANAAVHASPRQYHDGRSWPHPSTAAVDVTDDLGHYRLFGLAPGAYFVSAVPTSSPSRLLTLSPSLTGQDVTFYPGTRRAPDAVVLQVEAGQHLSGVSFTLVPPPASEPMARGPGAESGIASTRGLTLAASEPARVVQTPAGAAGPPVGGGR